LEVAIALGYLDSVDERITNGMPRNLGTLTNLVR
jgi:hypothetical protein